jgi:hypothetical protein
MAARDGGWSVDLFQRLSLGSEAAHSAFPGLVRFQGRWIAAWREGASHASADGVIRVATSRDFVTWTERATLSADLDPSIGGYRDVRGLVLAGDSVGLYTVRYDTTASPSHQSWVIRSPDGITWDETPGAGVAVGEPGFWMWSERRGPDGGKYSLPYQIPAGETRVRMYRSSDGLDWETWVETVDDLEGSTEWDLAWDGDGRLLAFGRVDGSTVSRWLTADPPYDTLPTPISTATAYQAPELAYLPDGRLILLARCVSGASRLSVGLVNQATGEVTRQLLLPATGDLGYIKAIRTGGYLYVIYYASHLLSKACIYVCRLRIPEA